jgi:O-methyltransferase
MTNPIQGIQARYIELMTLCLTRIAFEQVDDRRYGGDDWPAEAETMIGIPRLMNIVRCVNTVVTDDIPGDVAECGVWRGGATIMMKAVLTIVNDTARNVWVCDSFQGCPEPDPRYPADVDDPHHTFDILAVPEATVRANFERYRLLDDRVRFLAGFFEDTLPGPIEQLAVLRLDGDMYSSTIHTLDALYPKVSPGGFVIVDDFGGSGNGCQQAVESYRDRYGVVEPFEWIADSGAIYWRKGA